MSSVSTMAVGENNTRMPQSQAAMASSEPGKPTMRFLSKMLLLVAASELLTALLTYPAWLLVETVADVPIHRVRDRVAMLLIAVGLVVFLPRWKVATRDALGYSLPRRVFLTQMGVGFVAGAALMIPLALTLLVLAIVVPNHGLTPLVLAALLGQGLLTGVAVGLIEETFFRGILYEGIRKESGILVATLMSSGVYAASHFLGGSLRLPASEVAFLSGFRVVGDVFSKFGEPLQLLDSLLALGALGILLCLIRARTGAIAAGAGFHGGAVCAITVLRGCSQLNAGSHWAWLVGTYNGVIGWLALLWISLIAWVYWIGPELSRKSKPSRG
jgi:membrane protease YdiL (CAAX protease family)